MSVAASRSLRALCLGPCALLVSVPAVASAADLHVGSGQTYATVQAAADVAMAGDVVKVHGGTYAGELVLDGSGTAAARIVIEPAGDGDVTLSGRVRMNGDYWDLSAITIQGVMGADTVSIAGDYNRLLGLEITGGNRDGVDGAGIGNEIRGVTIHNQDAGENDAHCIVLNPGAEDWVIADSELYDCSGDAIQLYSAGLERTILNTRIERNHMYFAGSIGRTENAVDVKNADGLTIFGNVMHGFPDNKVLVFQKGPANIMVECNVMYDGFTGVEFRAEDGGTVENITFVRNLMHDYSEYALKFDGTVGATVLNNTFVDIGSDGLRIEGLGLDGGTIRNNAWLRTGSIDAGSFDASYNAFFQTGAIGPSSASDVLGDPLLDANYELGAGSPLIDAGTDVGALFAGAAPDIGWREVGLDDACDLSPGGPGGGGAGGGPGSGGSGSGTGAGGSGATGGGAGASGGEDGCSCRTASEGGRNGAGALLGLLVACATIGRRRGSR
jgi:hypothetical protein